MDGREEASATVGGSDSHNHGNGHANRPVAIGARQNNATSISFDQHSMVFVDEVRIVKGTAVYTSNFDVPTSRLTEITNTKVLIHSNLDREDSSGRHHVTRPAGSQVSYATTAGPYTGCLLYTSPSPRD